MEFLSRQGGIAGRLADIVGGVTPSPLAAYRHRR
jgi:hypothetical protein